ncbi:MAG TPA: thioredoxin family protein, partial [Spirochaetota bacterium]|nr:thioredoxin family protein [Spirochaetota bacterium]
MSEFEGVYVVKNGLCVIALIALISVTAGVMAQNKSVNSVKVTFIELGSVNCVPCRMMQPVMDKVRKKYGAQVNVVFQDVWTDKGR